MILVGDTELSIITHKKSGLKNPDFLWNQFDFIFSFLEGA